MWDSHRLARIAGDSFMQDKLIAAAGLTFDDVLIEPRYSEVVPAEVERRHAAHHAHRAARRRSSARRWTR